MGDRRMIYVGGSLSNVQRALHSLMACPLAVDPETLLQRAEEEAAEDAKEAEAECCSPQSPSVIIVNSLSPLAILQNKLDNSIYGCKPSKPMPFEDIRPLSSEELLKEARTEEEYPTISGANRCRRVGKMSHSKWK